MQEAKTAEESDDTAANSPWSRPDAAATSPASTAATTAARLPEDAPSPTHRPSEDAGTDREASLVADASTPSLPDSHYAVMAATGIVAEAARTCLSKEAQEAQGDLEATAPLEVSGSLQESDESAAKLSKLWSWADVDKDGWLNRVEVERFVLATEGVKLHHPEYVKMCKALGADPERGISFDQWKTSYDEGSSDVDSDLRKVLELERKETETPAPAAPSPKPPVFSPPPQPRPQPPRPTEVPEQGSGVLLTQPPDTEDKGGDMKLTERPLESLDKQQGQAKEELGEGVSLLELALQPEAEVPLPQLPHSATESEVWVAQWKHLSSEASRLESECAEILSRQIASLGPFQREMRTHVEEASKSQDAWDAGLWQSLGQLRKRTSALGRHMSKREHAGDDAVRLPSSVSQALRRDMEAFKVSQRQDFESVAAEELRLMPAAEAAHARHASWLDSEKPPAMKCRAVMPSAVGCLGGGGGGGGGSSSSQSRPQTPAPAGEKCQQKVPSSPSQRCPSSSRQATDAELQQLRSEMEALDSEMEKAGGITGGWSVVRHDVFMRVLRMLKMQAGPRFYAVMEERLPDMPRAAIDAHLQWHADNEERQSKRKRLLDKWRRRREELEREVQNQHNVQQSREAEQQKRAASRERHERKKLRQEIQEWRERRAEEEDEFIAQQRNAEASRAKEQAAVHQRLQQERKEAVEAFRQQRETEAARLNAAEDLSRPRALSQEAKQRIQKRSVDLLRKKLLAQRRSAGNLPAAAPAAGDSQASKAYSFVESRLYAETRCFTEKVKAANEQQQPQPPLAAPPLPPRSGSTFAPKARSASWQPNSGRRSRSADTSLHSQSRIGMQSLESHSASRRGIPSSPRHRAGL